MLENLTYFLNGASLSFFAMGAFHMAIYARQSKSRPHYLFTICLIWMALIELKEFFLSHDAAYNYEILGPGFTFPDLFTLALLSLFFFELVMPGRITARYSLKLLSPFVLLGGAYWLGTAFEPRTVYASRQSNESGAPFSEAPPYQSKYRSYSVTRSSHFTIPSITPIEMMQTEKNTVQATQIG